MSGTGVRALGEEATASRVTTPLALVGPTAAGKTALSLELASRLGAEIVVVDSMTVYRGMDVGTAKPTEEERRRIPHHLLDVADPSEPFSVARFQELGRRALADIAARGRSPLLVGGSGLYLRALVDDLRFPGTDPSTRAQLEAEGAALGPARLHERLASFDPQAAGRIEPGNLRRSVRALEVAAITGRAFSAFASGWDSYPPDRMRAAGLLLEPAELSRRIEERIRAMLAAGLVGEVRALLERGAERFLTSSQAIGYLEVVQHLRGRMTIEEVVAATARRTRGLARRQMAWFRRDPRIRWFHAQSPTLAADIEEHLRP